MRHFKKKSQVEKNGLELNTDNKPSKRGNRNRKKVRAGCKILGGQRKDMESESEEYF